MTARRLLLATALVFLFPASLWADGRIVWEFGAGLAKQSTPSPFYSTTQPSLNTGIGMMSSLLVQLTQPYSGLRVFFGPSLRYSAGSDGTNYFGMTNVHALLRFALPGIYLGFGATPLVYRRDRQMMGIDGYQRVTNAVAYVAELGIEVILNPEASLGVAGSLQQVNLNGGANQSPKFAFDACAFIRIYFLSTRDAGSTSEEFKGGWRYPFGLEKR